MTSTAPDAAIERSKWALRFDAPIVGLACVILVTTVIRFTVGADRPLWLDETQTGMLVMQPTLADFVRQCTYDINAPLYYGLARLWAGASGVSDHALRFLPAALAAAAPLIALAPRRLIDRRTRFTWCALLACWVPGIIDSQEARWYSLAFALGVANAVTYVVLLRAPSRRAAWLWATVASLLILAHYYGALLAAVQGVVYLMVHRRRALATWPAALAFAPALAAIAIHARRLIIFTTPTTTWIPLTKPIDLLRDAAFIVGGGLPLLAFLVWIVPMSALQFRYRRVPDPSAETGDREWTVAACSLAAVAIALGVGFFAPVYVERYVTAFVPGILLGLAKLANRFTRGWELAAFTLVALMFTNAVVWALGPTPVRDIHTYNFETASEALIASHTKRLVFFWDNPLRPEKSALAGLGGFFFARAGHPVPVEPIVVANGVDPNGVLLQHADPPGSAILWMGDRGVRGTAANRFHPAIGKLDPAWQCRNFGDWQYRIIGCSRTPAWRPWPNTPPTRASAGSAKPVAVRPPA